jgi:hypothetical protein
MLPSLRKLSRGAATLWRDLSLPRVFWYLAAAAFVTSGVGILSANDVVLPAADAVAVLPAFAWALARRRLQTAALLLVLWVICKAVAVAFWTVLLPSRAASAVAFGPGFAEGMFIWLQSGADLADVGAGVSFRLVETLAVAGGALLTGGVGGLVVAAVLLNCQAYYVGLLLARSVEPWRVLAFGWPLWEIFRALGLVNLLLAAAEPLASRLSRRRFRAVEMRDALLVGLLMLAAAFVSQIYLGPVWRDALAPYIIFDPGTGLLP